jgi:hypothetical protein
LQEKFYTIKKGTILVLHHRWKDVILYLKPEDFDDLKKRATVIGELWELISLISYLSESRYITKFKLESKILIDFMYEGFNNLKSSKEEISYNDQNGKKCIIYPDRICNSEGDVIFKAMSFKESYEVVKDNLFGLVYPTETIRTFVKNNYKSEEDIKFKKQTILAWIAIILAFITSIISIKLSIDSSNQNSKTTKKQMDIITNIQNNQLIYNNDILETIKDIDNNLNKTLNRDSTTYNLIINN